MEAINFTIKDYQTSNGLPSQNDHVALVARQNDDLLTKLKEHDMSELKIGFKIFLNCDDNDSLYEAIEKGKWIQSCHVSVRRLDKNIKK